MPHSRNFGVADPGDKSPHPVGGKNYLLTIGIDQYQHCRPLKNAIRDVEAFAELMKGQYSFAEDCIIRCLDADASRAGIWRAFKGLKQKLTTSDSLIIYYAGHGHLNEELDWGYWVPVNAKPTEEYGFIRNREIIDFIRGFSCYHVVLISDSCFSGSFFGESRDLTTSFSSAPSRWAITSGRKQKVLDGDPGLGSPFAEYLMKYLRENASSLLLSELGNQVKVATNAHTELYQTPRAEPLQVRGHEGGEFVFRRKELKSKGKGDPLQKDLSAWNKAKAADSYEGYKAYLDSFPEGEFREPAESRIAQLSAFSLGEKDIAAWKRAKEQKSLEGYRAYLRDFPEGEFALLAQKALERLQKTQASFQAERHRKEKLAAYFEEGMELMEDGAYKDALECLQEALGISKEGEKKEIEQAIALAKQALEKAVPKSHPLLQELGIEMVRVEGGRFKLGGEIDCTLSDFEIGKFPITQAQWQLVMGNNPSQFNNCQNCPVEQVSWEDCQEFISKLNELTSRKFRLPTEAQWEFAARGGKLSKGYTYAGGNSLESLGFYRGNSGGKTHPVGQKKPNELGLYDMSGNVREWCQDWYGAYPETPLINPMGPDTGQYRVLRGGSWDNYASYCRVSDRGNFVPSYRGSNFGFRLARDGS